MTRLLPAVCFASLVMLFQLAAVAEEKGKDDLDEAIDAQLTAKTLADLEQVVSLCESALKKGLDEGNTLFANQLLSSTLVQHAQRVFEIIARQPPSPQRDGLVKSAIENLEKATKANEKLPDAHLLLTRLYAATGDVKSAGRSAGKAIKLLDDDPQKKSEALLLRAGLSNDPDKQFKDLDAAVAADPENLDARQMRAMFQFSRQKFDEAIADIEFVLKADPTNVAAMQALAQAYVSLNKPDQALEQIDGIIKQNPVIGYRLRAGIHVLQEKIDEAIKDLDEAIKLAPRDVPSLLLRSELHQSQNNLAEARKDVELVLRARPGLVIGIHRRAMVAAAEGRMTSAIADMQLLLANQPDNLGWRLQLALMYDKDRRPQKAIEEFTTIIEQTKDNWQTMEMRASTYLSIGSHAEAIKDFNAALKLKPDDNGILNNLAWVLATSPDDELRDGKRSIELGKRACELTEFKKPHILSTYAAGFAETGDFENARKWSAEAVEKAKALLEKTEDEDEKKRSAETLKQLEAELQSYKDEKPWRERQEVKENPDPIQRGGSDLET